MKNMHLPSYGAGFVTGLLVLGVFWTGHAVFGSKPVAPVMQQRQFGGPNGGGADRMAGMAERMGISVEELQKELDTGKTMQQIAEEHGVTFGGGGFVPRSGTGGVRGANTGSGSSVSSSQSSL